MTSWIAAVFFLAQLSATDLKSSSDEEIFQKDAGSRAVAVIPLIDGDVATVVYHKVREGDVEYAVFQGDIILGPVSEVEKVTADLLKGAGRGELVPFGSGRTGQRFRWPNRTVPYFISQTVSNHRPNIKQAIAHWESLTAITFVELSADTGQGDYVRFTRGTGCSSSIGRVGGRQNIFLGNCSKGNIIHEIGHAVGLWHEQSRNDRDQYVTIVWENIKPGFEDNFYRTGAAGIDLGAYDFASIMHYGATFFSKNGRKTIVTRSGQSIGQRERLSEGDLRSVAMLYGTSSGSCSIPTFAPSLFPYSVSPRSD